MYILGNCKNLKKENHALGEFLQELHIQLAEQMQELANTVYATP